MNLPFGRRRYQARQQAHAEHLAHTYTIGYGHGVAYFEAGLQLPHRPEPGSETAAAYDTGLNTGYVDARQQQLDEMNWAVSELAKSGISKLEAMLAGELPPGLDPDPQDVHGGDEAA